MEYGINELSLLAGVSARTLRYYDEIGLLKPSRVSDAGYRFYGKAEVALLQQIMFYKNRGFALKKIEQIIYEPDFNIVKAMEEHLLELENQKAHVDLLIQTVKKTLKSMKGDCEMSDYEKFQAFKEKTIRENEAAYGEEIRKKYGDEEVNASNRKMLNMSEDEVETFFKLEEEILMRLENAVKNGIQSENEEAREIVELHKKWLCMAWSTYDVQVHKGVTAMYITDERFTEYYDRKAQGCAMFLNDAVQYWAK